VLLLVTKTNCFPVILIQYGCSSSRRDSSVPTFASEHLDSLFGALEKMITRPQDAYPSRIVSLGCCVRLQVVISDV
jgi:hypothetical protein